MNNKLLHDRLAGTLLGTAVGDALGLYMEGLSAESIRAQFPSQADIARYYLVGNIGFVSDDTEQSALLGQALISSSPNLSRSVKSFRSSMLGWFCRMPFGVGRATSSSCMKILMGAKATGIRSAGNGAAMRAAILGVFFYDDQHLRQQFGTALAEVTHTDARAVEGALFVADLAAACANSDSADEATRLKCFDQSIAVVQEASLKEVLKKARELAVRGASIDDAGTQLGCSGFVNHSVPLATFAFLRFGDNCLSAIQATVTAGGDTDSNAAIVGALCGALLGERGLPAKQIQPINDGPFGPTHLRKLAKALADSKEGIDVAVPGYLWPVAFARNVAVIPILLSHTCLRLARRGKVT
ncbi:MAG: ADP-ribosylglycohydrolase family protein [Cyanobacteria bacterium SZAS-4]|nr:ADP-ribosylglycohydrolase family protein [Cyanobacteria bacterium SZAS-4]